MRFAHVFRFVAGVFALSSVSAFSQTTLNVPATYTTIQAAINAASSGDTVKVAAGTYTEHVTITGKSITLDGTSGSTQAVTLNGSGLGPSISITGSAASQTVVKGFIVQNAGKPQTTGGIHGAIYISAASPTLTNLTLSANYCAGVLALNSNLTLSYSKITGTLATGCAAEEGTASAVVISGADTNAASGVYATILGNTIYSNVNSPAYSGDTGGGAALNVVNQTTIYITSNLMRNNVSAGYGGAIYTASTPSMYITNNLIYGNAGISGGLDLVIPGSSVGDVLGVLANNTIAFNSGKSKNSASELYIGGNLAQYQVVNNIIVGSADSQYAVNCGTTYSGQTLTPLVMDHNDFYSLPTSTNTAVGGACSSPVGSHGNISKDPLFVTSTTTSISAGTANLQLQQGSPAIDTGTDSVLPYSSTDYTLTNSRYVDATGLGYAVIDMGAYEYASSNTTTKNVLPMTLTPSTWTPTVGANVTLTAAFLGLPSAPSVWPTGSVTFYEDGTALGTVALNATDTSSSVSYPVTGLASGTHVFYATYAGDSTYAATSTVYLDLLASAANATTTQVKVKSSLNPSTVGDTVVLTAAVTPVSGQSIPTGKVYFVDGATVLGGSAVTLDADGNASLSVSTFTKGTHSITASYIATGDFANATGPYTQIVDAAALKSTTSVLSFTPNAASYGETTTFTATVTPVSSATVAPTGNVQFLVDGTAIGTVASVASGTTATATYSSTSINAGSHSYSCQYAGDSVYAASTCSTLTGSVTAASSVLTLTVSTLTPRALTPFTATAHLTSNSQPVASGAITLTVGTSTYNLVTNSSGDATFTLRLDAGLYSLTAVATASGNYSSSQAPASVQVLPNDVSGTLLATPTTAYEGQTVNLVVTLADLTGAASPSGSVVFYEGTTSLGTVNLAAASLTSTVATATLPYSQFSVGSHTVTATYLPDLNSNSLTTAMDPVTITVLASSFTITTDPTTISIQTEHHKSLSVSVTSVGAFSGTVTLSCATPLPPVLTCSFGQNSLTIQQNSTTTTPLTLETDAIANFYSQNDSGKAPFKQRSIPLLAAGSLLAAALFFRRRRGRLPVLTLSLLAFVGMIGLNGCSGHYPAHTPAGTYDIVINGTGVQLNGETLTESAHLTLVVTP